MDKTQTLNQLAEALGIELVYWDVFGHRNKTSDETTQLIIAAMGLKADTEDAATKCLQITKSQIRRQLLQAVTVARCGKPILISLTLPIEATSQQIQWLLKLEDGGVRTGCHTVGSLQESSRHTVDNRVMVCLSIFLPDDIENGYHTIIVKVNGILTSGVVVIAPYMSYLPNWFSSNERSWGVACHLYSLRSQDDWGIGDFTVLSKLANVLRGTGAVCIGVNPLHALFYHNPRHCSPYSPSSRLFLNTLYIDVTAVPEFATCEHAQRRVKTTKFYKRLEQIRSLAYVDYPAVAELKYEILDLLYTCFELSNQESERYRDFEFFCEEGGEVLYRFAVYQALIDAYSGQTWQQWPALLQDPDNVTVSEFTQDKTNTRRVSYYLYLQWEAHRQFKEAAHYCNNKGLTIGFYQDLAVGVDSTGFDVWNQKECFSDANIGAPPDQFNAQGQNWGLPPLDPLQLREYGYTDFISTLRANMRHAGALRVDHVMTLMRLFWIPLDEEPTAGAYVKYPLDDLLGVLALESWRHQCMIVGEDLGTVPPLLRERMSEEGILSYRVLMFERWPGENLFKRPAIYPPIALATASTHDLPTAIGYWQGTDVALKQTLNLIPVDQPTDTLVTTRARDRKLLYAALVDQGLLEQDFSEMESLDEKKSQILIMAIHRFLARSTSRLMIANLDDLLLETMQLNLPGTVDEYPNWKRRSSQPVELLNENIYFLTSVANINIDRHSQPPPE